MLHFIARLLLPRRFWEERSRELLAFWEEVGKERRYDGAWGRVRLVGMVLWDVVTMSVRLRAGEMTVMG